MGASSQLVFDSPLPIFPSLPAPNAQTFWHLCEGRKGQVLAIPQVQGLLRGVGVGDQHSSLGAAGAGWGLRDGKELSPWLQVLSLPRPKRVVITELQNGLWRSLGGGSGIYVPMKGRQSVKRGNTETHGESTP